MRKTEKTHFTRLPWLVRADFREADCVYVCVFVCVVGAGLWNPGEQCTPVDLHKPRTLERDNKAENEWNICFETT